MPLQDRRRLSLFDRPSAQIQTNLYLNKPYHVYFPPAGSLFSACYPGLILLH